MINETDVTMKLLQRLKMLNAKARIRVLRRDGIRWSKRASCDLAQQKTFAVKGAGYERLCRVGLDQVIRGKNVNNRILRAAVGANDVLDICEIT